MKWIGVTLLLLITISFESFSQTCLSGNCSSGFGKFQYANGDVYEGEFYDDKREGFGVYKWKTGEKFMGESMGDVFKGFGVMEFRDGTKYIGDFKDGELDGEGEKTYPNGVKKIGIFEKGKYLGKISYYNKPIGTTGCLNGDCEGGYGMKYYSGNDRYFGFFKNGKRHGYGAYYWDDGTRWVGQFDQNLITGYGSYFFITGEKYVGFFIDSKRNGWGINYDPESGIKKIGYWENNVLVKPKKSLITNGASTGCISGDCKSGYGKYVYNNGYYEGNFKNGYRHGQGTYYYDIGDYYTGNFSENKYNGKGTYYYTNGERYDGEWRDQRYHGKGQLFHFDGLPEEGYWSLGKFLGPSTPPSGYEHWVKNNYSNDQQVAVNSPKPNTTNPAAGTNKPTNTNSKPTNTNTNPVATGKPTNTGKPTTTSKPTNTNTQIIQTGGGSNTQGLNNIAYKRKLALVIGNQAYQHASVLRNPKNDARSMAQILRQCGFEVIEVIDGDGPGLKSAIREFGYKLKSYEVGLFYYSGHGIQIDDKNYIIPIDANLRSKTDVREDCPSVSQVLSRMEEAGTKLNIVILDACRNNPFERGSFGEDDEGGGLAPITPPDNTVISFATDPGSVASDGVAGTNGLYTGSLVRFISVPNTQLENVFKLTGKEVKEKSGGKQKPWLNSNFYDIFYFKAQ